MSHCATGTEITAVLTALEIVRSSIPRRHLKWLMALDVINAFEVLSFHLDEFQAGKVDAFDLVNSSRDTFWSLYKTLNRFITYTASVEGSSVEVKEVKTEIVTIPKE